MNGDIRPDNNGLNATRYRAAVAAAISDFMLTSEAGQDSLQKPYNKYYVK